MAGRARREAGAPITPGMAYCKVESLVAVDARGQMVLPKELREKAGIQPGEKLALVSMEQDGRVCCISLVRAEELTRWASQLLGPLMSGLARDQKRRRNGGKTV